MQSSGKEVPAGRGLESESGQGKEVRAGVVLEMVERVDLIPDMLKIQNLSILWRPARKDIREKSC